MTKKSAKEATRDGAGVSGAEDRTPEPGLPERTSRLDEIVANARKVRKQDIEDGQANEVGALPPDPEQPPEVPPEEGDPPTGATPEPPENDPPENEPPIEEGGEPAEDEVVTIKVDGEEKTVPVSSVLDAGIRTLQKETAADRRLAEAAEIKKAALELQQAVMAAQQQVGKTPPEDTTSGPSQEDAKDVSEVTRKVTEAIYSGDEEVAVEALNELVNTLRTSTREAPEQVASIVDQRLSEFEMARQQKEAITDFQKEYPDIASDPRLYALADQETIAILQEHPDWTLRQITLEAGARVTKFVADLRGDGGAQEPTPGVSVTTEKQERKRTATPPPSASARIPTAPEPKPKTKADIVAEMRSRRPI